MTWWIRSVLIVLVIMLGWMGVAPSMAMAVEEHPREESVEAPGEQVGVQTVVQAIDGDHGAGFQIVPELTNPPEMPVAEVQPEVWSPLDWLSGAISGEQSPPASPTDQKNDMDARGNVGMGNGTDYRVDATLEQWLSSVKALFAAQ